MSKVHDASGPTRDNMAAFYQSGERPKAIQDIEERDRMPVDPTTGMPLPPRVKKK